MENLLHLFKNNYSDNTPEDLTLEEYLTRCKTDPMAYATAAERMLAAIGQPELVDTSKDPRLSRIFMNRKIKRYPAFNDFFGMEQPVEDIVSFYKHAAQGLEERKQIIYLLGPVGGGKSSLAEKLKALMEVHPVYVLTALNKDTGEWEHSPVLESPLGIFPKEKYASVLEAQYGIPERYLTGLASPWAAKRLREANGDLSMFKVTKMWPSRLNQIAITKTEPGDENNQDISNLVGKVDIRKLEDYSQDDPDAYSYAGGLNIATQGILEFVEMFKAPIKMLHPLLTATQEGNYNGTQGFGAMPFQGIILAHSNESEWESFRNDKRNEAFLDRVYIVKVPYCLRTQEEVAIYKKLLRNSQLSKAPIAPGTLEMLAQFSVLTRIVDPENSNIFSKMRIYDGENLKDLDPRAKSLQEYRDVAGVTEGMSGMSTRFAYKILSRVFNFDSEEVAANPIHLMYVLEKALEHEQLDGAKHQAYVGFIKGYLAPKYADFIGEELQKAYLESYSEYGQNLFDRYINYADHWIQDQDFRDPDTGEQFDRRTLNDELEKIEKAAGISNAKDFRNEVVNFVLRARASNQGKNPDWRSYEKLRNVIEKKMFSSTEELLPVISFGTKKNSDEEKKHNDFVQRMMKLGYTEKQVRLLVEWYQRYKKHS
jgi:serine protein kinase